MHIVRDHAAMLAIEDEEFVSRSPARVLITASTHQTVETLARRLHARGPRAQFPFVQVWADELPLDRGLLAERCGDVLAAAAGGTLLIGAVELMPPAVQEALIELLAALESCRGSSAAARVIAGTTVSLLERVNAGTFSDQLFYRLTVLQVKAVRHDDESENV